MNRLQMLQQAAQFNGTYLSKEWIMKKVLHLTDEEMKEMQKQIESQPAPEPEDSNAQ